MNKNVKAETMKKKSQHSNVISSTHQNQLIQFVYICHSIFILTVIYYNVFSLLRCFEQNLNIYTAYFVFKSQNI